MKIDYELYIEDETFLGVVTVNGESEADCEEKLNAYLNAANQAPDYHYTGTQQESIGPSGTPPFTAHDDIKLTSGHAYLTASLCTPKLRAM